MGEAGEPRKSRVGEAGLQNDLELALLQMKTATLARMDEALVRLDVGKYGCCTDCDGPIGEPRLRAQPFAVRCQACEQRREQEQPRRATCL